MRHHPLFILLTAILLGSTTTPSRAEPGDTVYETCPSAEDVGDNVTCYPVTFTAKTEIHPEGIPIIGYLFVPKNRAIDEPLSAMVFAHGSGSMYSSGNHNKGLNSKHKQWVKQYTNDLGIVGLHVSSFHSRYLLPDTEGDQRVLDIDLVPGGVPGGDDYRATSTLGGLDGSSDDLSNIPLFDPEQDDWKDQENGGAGVSEVTERAYDMDAAWDFLAGVRQGQFITPNSRNDDNENPTLGAPMTGIGYIGEIVTGGLIVDHERIFMYGTSHGGQTAMAAAHAPRALGDANPMNADMSEGFNGKRFAAFFDYYGGCGLFGAYGGADSDSTWRPYAPFLMLHGENDDIWKDQTNGSTREQWLNSDCKPRIDAAKVDPEFEQFLEAIVYAGADHSFDGVESSDISETSPDFESWLAKIHANYRMTVPFMEAIGRQVAAARNDEDVPVLAELGFPDRLSYFATFPLTPYLGPQSIPGSALYRGEPITIDDLANAELDLTVQLHDPFEFFDVTCALLNAPASITVSDECVMQLELTEQQLATLSTNFWIQATTVRGHILIPARVEQSGEGSSGRLTFMQEFYALPISNALSSMINLSNGDAEIFTDAFVWTRFKTHAHRFRIEPTTSTAYSTAVDLRYIFGAPSDAPLQITHEAYANGNGLQFDLGISEVQDDTVNALLSNFEVANLDDENFRSDPLPTSNYLTNFEPLDPVDTIPDENNPPQANAGENQSVESGATVTLSGNGLDEEDEPEMLSYEWAQTDGNPPVGLDNPQSAVASFTAPVVTEITQFTFALTVTDTGEQASDPAAVTVTVNPEISTNNPPTARAGDNREVVVGEFVTLDGRNSTDEDPDDTLTFAWLQAGGDQISLEDLGNGLATFTASITGEFTFTLTATDTQNATHSDDVTITVVAANSAPIANAGADMEVIGGKNVVLSGSESTDENVATLSYEWSQLSGNQQLVLSNDRTVEASFTAPIVEAPTAFTFQLRVTDEHGLEDAATIRVTVHPGGNPPPLNTAPDADAGEDVIINASSEVTLDGSSSKDPDDHALTFRWSRVDGGPPVELENEDAAITKFTAPAITVETTLTFRLTVADEKGLEDTDIVVVTVKPKPSGGGDGNVVPNPGSGGGALFWLLPFALLFNRRK